MAEALDNGGQVIAVDESPEMFTRLTERLAGVERARALQVSANRVALPGGSSDRILAVNVLHEIRGEPALAEMRRLLAPGGFVLVVDWERGRPRTSGPPDPLLYTAAEAADALRAASLDPEPVDAGLPFHFALRGVRLATGRQED